MGKQNSRKTKAVILLFPLWEEEEQPQSFPTPKKMNISLDLLKQRPQFSTTTPACLRLINQYLNPHYWWLSNLNTFSIIMCEVISYSQNEEHLLLHWEQKISEVVLEIYIYILVSIQRHRQIENAFVTSSRWRYLQPTHLLMSLHGEDMQHDRSSKLPPSVERVPKLRTQVQSEIYLQAIVCSVCPIRGNGKWEFSPWFLFLFYLSAFLPVDGTRHHGI